MAKGNLSPRQRMINLMYLVFIAMMAMNVDREVLRAFDEANNTLELSNKLAEDNNRLFYENLKIKADKDPNRYQKIYKQALSIKKESENFVSYLKNVKTQLRTGSGLLSDSEEFDYKAMESSTYLNKFFFEGEKPSQEANKFQGHIETYKKFMMGASKGEAAKKRITQLFSTEPIRNKPWMRAKFLDQPLIAALTHISKMETDVRNEESHTLSTMLAGKLEEDIVLRDFEAIVVAPKTLMVGERVQAKIMMGAYDNALKGTIVANGQSLSMNNGQGLVGIGSSSPGTYTLSGRLEYRNEKGQAQTKTFTHSYEVIADKITETPKGGVVAAEKMNVVYRGVNNPITASIPGINPGSIKLSASNGSLSGGNGKWIYKPAGGSTVDFTVSGVTGTGQKVTSGFKFRIKDVPAPQGTVRSETEPAMPASTLKIATIGAIIPDFEFDVNLVVNSFTVKIPGEPTIPCSGNKLNARAQQALDRVRPGQTVVIGNINASMVGSSQLLKKISPIAVSIR